MTEREMLEMAAKAAGIVIVRSRLDDPLQRDMLVLNSHRNPGQKAGPWNPLADDGDALRLAVKLRLDICRPHAKHKAVCVWVDVIGDFIEVPHGRDAYAATRLAIVRAAAEIGRAMP